MDFFNLYAHGFVRVAACNFPITLAQPQKNAEAVADYTKKLSQASVALAVFPQRCLSGYSLDDLLLQDTLLDGTQSAFSWLTQATKDFKTVIIVGAPLRHLNRVYDCAVALYGGTILGVVPKSYAPSHHELYERRQITPGDDQGTQIKLAGQTVPFGTNLIFAATNLPEFAFSIEISDDSQVPIPPSAAAAMAGATLIANPSSSPTSVGKAAERKKHCESSSARLIAGYLLATAGAGESSTDLAWDGQTLIYEAGTLLAQSASFSPHRQAAIADVDLGMLCHQRQRLGTFDDCERNHADLTMSFRRIEFELAIPAGDLGLQRKVSRFPFISEAPTQHGADCKEVLNIQVSALAQRLQAIGNPKIILGISGGLDSTHALIVAAKAMDRLHRPRTDILGFTMPGFATSAHTKANATSLAHALGITFSELDIRPAANLMLRELENPFAAGEKVYDVTFENVQAGLRTDFLFRLANQRGGIVLGTGDMSELALGWCTYGVGDQMSHYNANAGVPKTFIKEFLRWVINAGIFGKSVTITLKAILETEISPELIPATETAAVQSTEATIGPFDLQDFNLFYTLRHGMKPTKIAFLAWHAWNDATTGSWPSGYPEAERNAYDMATIKKWLKVFCQRFFGFAQFKRSASPNGPKVFSAGSLSPRGDWRMPSDISAKLWLQDTYRIPDKGSIRRLEPVDWNHE